MMGGKDQELRYVGCEFYFVEGKVVGIGFDVGKVFVIELKFGVFCCDEFFGGFRVVMGCGYGVSYE